MLILQCKVKHMKGLLTHWQPDISYTRKDDMRILIVHLQCIKGLYSVMSHGTINFQKAKHVLHEHHWDNMLACCCCYMTMHAVEASLMGCLCAVAHHWVFSCVYSLCNICCYVLHKNLVWIELDQCIRYMKPPFLQMQNL